jgi:DnaK suppressor protein
MRARASRTTLGRLPRRVKGNRTGAWHHGRMAGSARKPDPALDLVATERELRARHDRLQARLTGLARPPEGAGAISFGKRIGEGTTEAISRLTDVGVGQSLEISAGRVARALQKLDEGSYGVCDGCGGAIAPRRLQVAPESVLCIDCARRGR